MALPIPRLPPVTRATVPANWFGISLPTIEMLYHSHPSRKIYEELSKTADFRPGSARIHGITQPVGGRGVGTIYQRSRGVGGISLSLFAHLRPVLYDLGDYTVLRLPATAENRLVDSNGSDAAHRGCAEPGRWGRTRDRVDGIAGDGHVADWRLCSLFPAFVFPIFGSLR